MYTKTQARIQADIKQTNWERRLYIAMKINQGRTHQSIAKELKITRQAVSEIWKKITAKYGYWSRQSLYNALKDNKLFRKEGNKFLSVSQENESIEKFVESVEKDQSVAAAV